MPQIDAVYIGYDSEYPLAYEVCKRSILKHESNITIIPLKKNELQQSNSYRRPEDNNTSTEYTYTRFLVPHLQRYQGHALYCDSSFLWQCSPRTLEAYIDLDCPVSVVKHDFTTCPTTTKFDNKPQVWYPRKNWSSLMLFNCTHPSCRRLRPNDIEEQTGEWLHQFKWVDGENDYQVGVLPQVYNFLIGYYSHPPTQDDLKAIHFTDGGPWLASYRNVPFADTWSSYLSWEEFHSIVN